MNSDETSCRFCDGTPFLRCQGQRPYGETVACECDCHLVTSPAQPDTLVLSPEQFENLPEFFRKLWKP